MVSRSFLLAASIVGGFSFWLAASLLLLFSANEWWLSGVTTLTVLAGLTWLLVAIYRPGRVRAAALGALIAGSAYWLFSLGPWFGTNLGPTLLSSRLLASADAALHPGAQMTQTVVWSVPQTYSTGQVLLTGSGVVNSSQLVYSPQVTTAFAPSVSSPGGTVFQSLGHWLLVWLAAGLGACAAVLMEIRSRRSPASPTAAPRPREAIGAEAAP